jgi:hypothetical protein
MRIGIWLPWPVWLLIIVFGGPLYLCWLVVVAAAFVIVTAIAWPLKRSFRESVRIGAFTFAWMIVPGHMARQHNNAIAH